MSKHVLGLDLGVGSIGWCLIALDAQGDPAEILGMGSRVVPLNDATKAIEAFNAGAAFTITKRGRRAAGEAGFAQGSIFAGYPHFHFSGETKAAERFVRACVNFRKKEK